MNTLYNVILALAEGLEADAEGAMVRARSGYMFDEYSHGRAEAYEDVADRLREAIKPFEGELELADRWVQFFWNHGHGVGIDNCHKDNPFIKSLAMAKVQPPQEEQQ